MSRWPVARARAGRLARLSKVRCRSVGSCASSSSLGTRRRSRRCPTSCGSRFPTARSCSRSATCGRARPRCTATARSAGPTSPDIVERVPVRVCQRRGAAVDLVLDRARENRSQFVFTKARGRDVIFWQSARTTRQARPNVTVPTARAAGRQLEIVVDSHERYPWTFSHQQATPAPRPARRRLRRRGRRPDRRRGRAQVAGRPRDDDDRRQAAVPARRSRGAARMPRWSSRIATRRCSSSSTSARRSSPTASARQPPASRRCRSCSPRPARSPRSGRTGSSAPSSPTTTTTATPTPLVADLPPAGPVPSPEPTTAEVRAWARQHGLAVADHGRLRTACLDRLPGGPAIVG